jgi:hypothetical protein
MSASIAALLPVTGFTPSDTDLGVTANTFASFAEIMTGFSFAALAIYLAYESAKGKHSADQKEAEARGPGRNERDTRDAKGDHLPPSRVGAEHPIRRTQVAATLFYSMASLAISSFLYASLTLQVHSAPKIMAALLLYGVVFGISVLTFFYALTLMTYENPATRRAAKAAYLVVVIAGPAVVLRFLAEVAQGAWNCRSFGSCSSESGSPPLLIGIVIFIFLLIISIGISLFRVFEKRPRLYRYCNWLCVRPVLPALVVFIVSVAVALLGIAVTAPFRFAPSEAFIWACLGGGSFLLGFFALACGCAVGPRLNGPPDATAAWRLAVLLARAGQADAALTVVRPHAYGDQRIAAWWLADLLAGEGRIEEAITVIRPHADDRATALRLADLLAGEGRIKEAITVIRPYADDRAAALRLADLLARQGRIEEAIGVIRPHADADHQTPHADGDHQTPHADGDHQTPHADGDHQTPHADADHQAPRGA